MVVDFLNGKFKLDLSLRYMDVDVKINFQLIDINFKGSFYLKNQSEIIRRLTSW